MDVPTEQIAAVGTWIYPVRSLKNLTSKSFQMVSDIQISCVCPFPLDINIKACYKLLSFFTRFLGQK